MLERIQLEAPPFPKWLENLLQPLLPSLNRYLVPVEDQAIHVMEIGNEGPTVFMLHGNPTWGFLYRKVCQELRNAGMRLIVPDLVGLGYSSRPRSYSAHTFENHARWIRALMDFLELEEVIFVGQDWGGPIGLKALSMGRTRARGLVLLNTALGSLRPGFRKTRFHQFSHMPIVSDLTFRLLGFPQNWMHKIQGHPSSIEGQVKKAYCFLLRNPATNHAPLAMARMVANSLDHPSCALVEDCIQWVQKYKGPAQLVWGTKDPLLGKSYKRFLEWMPQAKVVLTDGGHFLQEEKPEEIAQAIREVVHS